MTKTHLAHTNQKHISLSLINFFYILREYHIHAGKTEMAASLKNQFPGEEKAIDEFMRLMKVEREGGNDNLYGKMFENGKQVRQYGGFNI